ncbi:hypothetical protein APR04_001753 [Promicromonospora umidemergens]|uniref:Methyltransferase family protein n=1 Tax=Promicromonospora umidemergens TaxID=629679 RepID=A0ABP8XIK5_9MICO|nr:hypothetical protein [Promicromonospora umidemergens]MCP2282850.1 hypothetical protein [Promicromonospora umidemergens]
MEFDESNIEFVQAGPEMVLELLAEKNHHDTSAAVAHQNIAAQLWPHLRALEYATGQLLAVGEDVDLLAGASPDSPRLADSIDDYEEGELLAAHMPHTDQPPHHGLRLRSARNHEVGAADLVLANLPLADTRALTRSTKTDMAMMHHGVIRDALTWLRPGGLLVTTAHRQLLEGTDAQPRRSIAKHADLIAAVRLPASALRRALLLDSPVDLLMLRRREPGHPPAGLNFIERSPVHIHDAPDMLINDCYAIAPWAAAGNIVPDPIDPDMTTVAPMGGDFGRTLSEALATHTDIAIDDGLYAKQRPARRARPAPPQNTPHNPSTGPEPHAL